MGAKIAIRLGVFTVFFGCQEVLELAPEKPQMAIALNFVRRLKSFRHSDAGGGFSLMERKAVAKNIRTGSIQAYRSCS